MLGAAAGILQGVLFTVKPAIPVAATGEAEAQKNVPVRIMTEVCMLFAVYGVTALLLARGVDPVSSVRAASAASSCAWPSTCSSISSCRFP